MNRGAESSETWLKRFRDVHPPVAARNHDPKFGPVYQRGEGSRLFDVEGRDYIDLVCGYSTTNLGHRFAPLLAAAQRQLLELTHVTGEAHRPRIELAERLVECLGCSPPPATRVLFNASGARAIETAWKAATAYRPGRIVTLGPAFHGRSIATSALSSNPEQSLIGAAWRRALGPRAFSGCGACVDARCTTACCDEWWACLEHDSDRISAVLMEPLYAARGGYLEPPIDFFERLQQWASRAGVLLIADEIQTGLGRCGGWVRSHAQGWSPDLIVLGKSLGGGIAPISAVVGRAEILDQLPSGSESETFAATPLACGVALEVLRQLGSGPHIAGGIAAGEELRDLLRELIVRWLGGGRVEGVGANAVLEFSSPNDSPSQRAGARQRAWRFAACCVAQRLLVQLSGVDQSRIVLLPAFNISAEEMRAAADRLRAAAEEYRKTCSD